MPRTSQNPDCSCHPQNAQNMTLKDYPPLRIIYILKGHNCASRSVCGRCSVTYIKRGPLCWPLDSVLRASAPNHRVVDVNKGARRSFHPFSLRREQKPPGDKEKINGRHFVSSELGPNFRSHLSRAPTSLPKETVVSLLRQCSNGFTKEVFEIFFAS